MLALKIIGGVLLFLFVLTLFPLRLELGFQQEFSLKLRYLFFAFRLLPGKEKEPEKEKQEEEEPKEETEKKFDLKKSLKRHGFSGFLKTLFELIQVAAHSTKGVLSHLKIKVFDLYLCLAGAEDAAEAAIRYGQLSGAVYSACGLLFGLTGCRKKAVTVDLDYKAEEDQVDFSARLSILPLFLLKEGVSLLIHGLPPALRLLRGGSDKNQKRKVTGNE